MEFTIFLGFGIELMLAKALKYSLDVILDGIQGMEHYQQKCYEAIACTRKHIYNLAHSKRLGVRGNGYWSFFVMWLRPWKSMQRHKEPSFFLTKRMGALWRRGREMEESSRDIYIKLVFCDFAYMVYVCVGKKLLFNWQHLWQSESATVWRVNFLGEKVRPLVFITVSLVWSSCVEGKFFEGKGHQWCGSLRVPLCGGYFFFFLGGERIINSIPWCATVWRVIFLEGKNHQWYTMVAVSECHCVQGDLLGGVSQQ